MPVKVSEILKKFPENISLLSGELGVEAAAPCSAENPRPKTIVFAPKPRWLENSCKENASIMVIPQKLVSQVNDILSEGIDASNQALLVAKDLDVAMAEINSHFFPIENLRLGFDGQKSHPTAVISKTAIIESDVIIGPHAVIGEKAVIGQGSHIGANAVIEERAKIGARCFIHSLAVIAHDCVLGNECVVQSHSVVGSIGYGYALDKNKKGHHKPHYGRVVLHDRVEVGANSSIDRGAFDDTVIGEGTKLDNKVHIGHNNIIGKNCMITASFSSAGSSKIGDNCMFAGGCRVGGHIEICSDCVFTGVTTISKSVTEPGVYGGWPLQKQKEFLRTQSALLNLSQMRKSLQKVLKHLKLED